MDKWCYLLHGRPPWYIVWYGMPDKKYQGQNVKEPHLKSGFIH